MIRVYLTIYVIFADAPCDELVVLTPKIDDDNEFFGIHYGLLVNDFFSSTAA